MARRLNPAALCVFIVLCILLIYASNRISLSPFTSAPPEEFMRTIKLHNAHRQYHQQSTNDNNNNLNFNSVYNNGYDSNSNSNNNRHSAKYNHIMHPHNTEQRAQLYNRKYVGGTGGVGAGAGAGAAGGGGIGGFQTSESATAETTNFINTTVRIEDIVDAQRQRIASKMKDFEYTEQMIGLTALTPETNGQPIQSVILSTWRSGSTFLGDILNSMPGNYYHYEPLLFYEIRQIRGPPESAEAIDTLRHLLKCNYTGLETYLDYGQSHTYLFTHNHRLWRNCQLYPQFCFDAQFLNPFCRLFPFQSMKVVRIRASLAEPLLIDASLNVKIVLLIRDPRGTIQSRKHREWCPGQPDCDTPSILCADMVSDFKAAEMLIKKYPSRFKAIRYEDLSLEPFKQTKDILNFYGLPFDADVEDFLDSHTRTDIGGVSSTFRDSKTAPFHWMRDLSFNEIQYIQMQCSEAMDLWGYKQADNEEALISTIFNPLLKFPFSSGNTGGGGGGGVGAAAAAAADATNT